jgi:organic radical activating enzyme
MNKSFKINQGVFYITNVCNLTCTGCETFNNRKFKGHFLWEDFKTEYIEWSKKLEIDFITIIGGEPFANPDLINWIAGIKTAWPDCTNINICTNGTYIKNNIDLARKILNYGLWLDVSIHDPSYYQDIKTDIEDVLSSFEYTIKQYNTTIDYYIKNKLAVRMYTAYNFRKSSQKYIKDGITYMHQSNGAQAHELCIGNLGHCHFFVKGLLYKCYLTATSTEFSSQFALEERAKHLLESYNACASWESDAHIEQFLKEIENPIPQCTLCPDRITAFPIWPMNKKK